MEKKTNNLTPMLFTCLKKYSGQQLVKDIIAGVIVAIIALPLSIALALASGVGPEQGIYTAIVAGFLISFFGGSTVQIAGPTAAFATIVAGIVAKNGMDGLIIATVIAGVILIIMGLCRVGALIKFIPFTIVTGFTAGIAVTIIIGQLKDFFGLTYAAGVKPVETMEKLTCVFEFFGTVNVWAIIVGIICLGILIIWPFVNKTIPGSLIAVIVGILLVKFANLPVNTIGDLYTINSGLPAFHLPDVSLEVIKAELPDGFTIAVLAAIESLLSCVVADGMVNSRHRSNMELVAQGIGNLGSALFGGIPATGAIARTAANIKNGGRTPVAGIVHSVVLVLVLLFLMPYAALIPMPTIAAILFMVAYNMCGWRTFVKLCKTAPKSDIAVLVVTFVLTVVFDLVVAIEVGMVITCVLFLKRMSETTNVKSWIYYDESDSNAGDLMELPEAVSVFEISGPMFFGSADKLAKINLNHFTKCLVLRMRSVPSLDATAMKSLEELYDRCQTAGVQVVFSHVNDQPRKTMEKHGFIAKVGEENFLPHIEEALAYASKLVGAEEKPTLL